MPTHAEKATIEFAVGYDSTSAFISAFKSTLGTTPGHYYADETSKVNHAQDTRAALKRAARGNRKP